MEELGPEPSKENALDWLHHFIRPYRKKRQVADLSLDDDAALAQRLELVKASKRQQGRKMP